MVTIKFHAFVIQVRFLTLKIIFINIYIRALDGYLDIYYIKDVFNEIYNESIYDL